MSIEEYIKTFDLQPLEGEGGFFRRVHTFSDGSVIYYALDEANFSFTHRLESDEVWFHLDGAAVTIVTIDPKGNEEEYLLDKSNPIVVVPAHYWQSARTKNAAALCATTMSPEWKEEEFTLADRAFIKGFPKTRRLVE